MLTAAEAQELLTLVRDECTSSRTCELAERVAHDMEIVELSVELTEKCEELGKYTSESVPPELEARIRELAEKLAGLDPEGA